MRYDLRFSRARRWRRIRQEAGKGGQWLKWVLGVPLPVLFFIALMGG